MPDVITAAERAMIDAALPRARVIPRGMSGEEGFVFDGERVRPVRNANPINRVQRARRDRHDAIVRMWGAGEEISAHRLGVSRDALEIDLRVLRYAGRIAGGAPGAPSSRPRWRA